MSKTPEIVKKVINLLETNGHQCPMYNISKGYLEWCNKDVCVRTKTLDDMKERNNRAYEFAKELHNKGHRCVEYLESYPVQISWCQQEICVKKN